MLNFASTAYLFSCGVINCLVGFALLDENVRTITKRYTAGYNLLTLMFIFFEHDLYVQSWLRSSVCTTTPVERLVSSYVYPFYIICSNRALLNRCCGDLSQLTLTPLFYGMRRKMESKEAHG